MYISHIRYIVHMVEKIPVLQSKRWQKPRQAAAGLTSAEAGADRTDADAGT